MKTFLIVLCALTVTLGGCGGGGGSTGTGPTTDGAGVTLLPASTQCGFEVGPSAFEGTVIEIIDGDTIKVQTATAVKVVRFEGVDAPESAQPFGMEARQALIPMLIGTTVDVRYSKTDSYDRVIGSVFTKTCQYTNLNQLEAGLAWFYKAYQCELPLSLRQRFIQAQDSAVSASRGLWTQSVPEAPWVYRNGTEPVTPICTTDSAAWVGPFGQTALVPSVSVGSGGNSGGTTGGTTGGSTDGGGTVILPPVTPPPSYSPTCYIGPRGGTYTITASGKKNYGGC